MKDNQKIYLDKVIEFLVRDTKIEEGGNIIFITTFTTSSPMFSTLYTPSFFNRSPNPYSNEDGYTSVFAKYVKNVYGLTDQETEYVWEEYKNIILDKIVKIGKIS
jgi:hypothetical protein